MNVNAAGKDLGARTLFGRRSQEAQRGSGVMRLDGIKPSKSALMGTAGTWVPTSWGPLRIVPQRCVYRDIHCPCLDCTYERCVQVT